VYDLRCTWRLRKKGTGKNAKGNPYPGTLRRSGFVKKSRCLERGERSETRGRVVSNTNSEKNQLNVEERLSTKKN